MRETQRVERPPPPTLSGRGLRVASLAARVRAYAVRVPLAAAVRVLAARPRRRRVSAFPTDHLRAVSGGVERCPRTPSRRHPGEGLGKEDIQIAKRLMNRYSSVRYWNNENQNYNKISPHTSQSGHHQ